MKQDVLSVDIAIFVSRELLAEQIRDKITKDLERTVDNAIIKSATPTRVATDNFVFSGATRLTSLAS